jgi:hypothetical protein
MSPNTREQIKNLDLSIRKAEGRLTDIEQELRVLWERVSALTCRAEREPEPEKAGANE